MRILIWKWALVLVLPLLTLSVGAGAQTAETFQIIVNSANPQTSLRRAYISKLFLRKVSTWDHGGEVSAADMPVRSPVRAQFSQGIHGKSASAVKSHWQQQIFSGRGVPPPEFSSNSEVVAYVRRHPGAIGYVSASASTKGVNVIEIRR